MATRFTNHCYIDYGNKNPELHVMFILKLEKDSQSAGFEPALPEGF
jgi:hypothetical protein